MDRPTCKTCAYFVAHFGKSARGHCRRFPPTTINAEIMKHEYDHKKPWGQLIPDTMWSETEYDDWCGEHSDFPAYLASLKEQAKP